jgi:hypothetical protein
MRAYSQIGQYPVNRHSIVIFQEIFQKPVIMINYYQSFIINFVCQGIFVTVKSEKFPALTQSFQDFLRMPPSPISGIHIDTVGPDVQTFDAFR